MLEWLVSLALMFLSGSVWSPDQDPVSPPATTTAQVVRVVDGDTIIVRLAGREERVRYIGIDTPEVQGGGVRTCFAEEATAANRALIHTDTVTLVRDQVDRDDYGRLLRYVYAVDTFVNLELAREGYARILPIPPNTQHAPVLAAAVADARADQVGLWGVCY